MSTDITGFWGDNQDINGHAANFSEGGRTLPPGVHNATIKLTELLPTNEGHGKNLFVVFDFAGVEKRECFNLRKKNGETNEITRADLAKLAVSAGVKGRLSDPMQLHGLKVACKLVLEDYVTEDGQTIKVNKFVNYQPVGTVSVSPGPTTNNGVMAQPAADAPW